MSLVTGSDLVDPLADLAAQENVPVALVGATRETLARAAAELAARHPGLAVVACLAPGQGFDPHGAEADELIEALRASGARLTFVALGAPRQEMFAAQMPRGAARASASCRSAPASTSSRATSAARRSGYGGSRWNGSGECSPNPGASAGATFNARSRCRG